MAHEKTWQFAPNKPFGDVSAGRNQTAWYFWQLVQCALGRVGLTDLAGAAIGSPGGLWTIVQCCDSTQVKTDGTDLFGSTFSVTPWVFAAAGTAHSWVTLQNVTLGIYITIDCTNTLSVGGALIVHSVAPTGGTTTAHPTATGDVTGASVALMDTVFSVSRKAHFALCTDGSFIFLHSKDGAGLFNGAIQCHKMTDLYAGDSYPVVVGAEYVAAGVCRSSSGPLLALYREIDGTVRTNGGVILPEINNSPWAINHTPPDTASKLIRWDARISNSTSYAIKGRIQDVLVCGKSTLDTDVVPSTGTVTDWHVGTITVPANVAPLL